jgi:flagellar motor protein MotB
VFAGLSSIQKWYIFFSSLVLASGLLVSGYGLGYYMAGPIEDFRMKKASQDLDNLDKEKNTLQKQKAALESSLQQLATDNSSLKKVISDYSEQQPKSAAPDESYSAQLTRELAEQKDLTRTEAKQRQELAVTNAALEQSLIKEEGEHQQTRNKLSLIQKQIADLTVENDFLRPRSETLSILQLPPVPADAEIQEISASQLFTNLKSLSEPTFQTTIDERYKGRWTPKPGWPASVLGLRCPDHCNVTKKHVHFMEAYDSSIDFVALTDSKPPGMGLQHVMVYGRIVTVDRTGRGIVILDTVQILPYD